MDGVILIVDRAVGLLSQYSRSLQSFRDLVKIFL